VVPLLGATLGKLLCGLRVTTADLNATSFGAAFRRSLTFWFESFFSASSP
jgi:uncharacterized RDD family membrane protein YckC